MIRKYISHPQDKIDAQNALNDIKYPSMIFVERMPPTKEHQEEYEKKQKQMAHFFRSVVPTYAKHAGVTELQARGELQIKFKRTGEIVIDETGAYDVVWLDGDKFRVFEQGKKYLVQSIGDMTNAELSDLIEKSKQYILQQYGVDVPEYKRKLKTKEIKK